MSSPLPLLRLLAAAQFLWQLCCDAAEMNTPALRGVIRGRLKLESPRVRTGQMPADYDDSGSSQETKWVHLAALDNLGGDRSMRREFRFVRSSLLPHGDRTQEPPELMAAKRSMTLFANHSHKQAALNMQGATASEEPVFGVSQEDAPDDEKPPEILEDQPNVKDTVEKEPQVEDLVPMEQDVVSATNGTTNRDRSPGVGVTCDFTADDYVHKVWVDGAEVTPYIFPGGLLKTHEIKFNPRSSKLAFQVSNKLYKGGLQGCPSGGFAISCRSFTSDKAWTMSSNSKDGWKVYGTYNPGSRVSASPPVIGSPPAVDGKQWYELGYKTSWQFLEPKFSPLTAAGRIIKTDGKNTKQFCGRYNYWFFIFGK